MHEDLAKVAQLLLGAEKILLTCPRGPDGDSVGSMVALASLLREHQKKVVLYNPDLVPRHLKWLPHAKTFVQQLKKKAKFDLTLIVDCGDANLLGKNFPEPEVTGTQVILDHHGSGRPFGDLFVSDASASAVGVMVSQLSELLQWPLSHDAAQGVYVSLISDTGGFRYSNTNGEVLKVAAQLVDGSGVSPSEVAERMSTDSSPGRYRLLSKLLASMEVAVSGRVAFITITPQLLKECGATWDDTEGMINYARSLRGVECGVLICPSKYGGTRVSMRTRGDNFDAGKICYSMGGGGHKGAAGCTLPGSLEETRKAVEACLTDVVCG